VATWGGAGSRGGLVRAEHLRAEGDHLAAEHVVGKGCLAKLAQRSGAALGVRSGDLHRDLRATRAVVLALTHQQRQWPPASPTGRDRLF